MKSFGLGGFQNRELCTLSAHSLHDMRAMHNILMMMLIGVECDLFIIPKKYTCVMGARASKTLCCMVKILKRHIS